MRSTWYIGALAGLLLIGCNPNPQTVAKRGKPANSDNTAKPAPHPIAPAAEAGAPDDARPLDDSGGEVKLFSLSFTAPKGWGRKRPQSSFIQAEYVLPRVKEDQLDGRLTLSVAGGSVEANIDRWKDQFEGGPKKFHQEKMEVGGLSITLADLSGDFNDQRGAFAPVVKRPGFRMLAAIIPVKDQLHFVKAVAAEKTMESQADKFKAFLRTVKSSK